MVIYAKYNVAEHKTLIGYGRSKQSIILCESIVEYNRESIYDIYYKSWSFDYIEIYIEINGVYCDISIRLEDILTEGRLFIEPRDMTDIVYSIISRASKINICITDMSCTVSKNKLRQNNKPRLVAKVDDKTGDIIEIGLHMDTGHKIVYHVLKKRTQN